MKNIRLLILGLMSVFSGCSIESKDGSMCSQSSSGNKSGNCSEPTSKADPENSPKKSISGLPAICSFKEGFGCLKANITSVDLRIGDFSYEYGIVDFGKQFPSDLAAEFPQLLRDAEHVEFARAVTTLNFFSGFDSTAEGSSTTYSPIHTGLGNLEINNMVPGNYALLLSKMFDLSTIGSRGEVIKRICVIMVTRLDTLIAPDVSSAPTRSLNDFDLELYDGQCSGGKAASQSFITAMRAPADGPTATAVPQDSKDTSAPTSHK